MAVHALDCVIERIGGGWKPCQTHVLSIGGANTAVERSISRWTERYPELSSYFRVLHERYGLDADGVCEAAMKFHGMSVDPLRAEVEYVCRSEMVCTLEDLIERRAGFLHWSPEDRLERLRYGAEVIRAELALTETEFEQQLTAYEQHFSRSHALPSEPAPTETRRRAAKPL